MELEVLVKVAVGGILCCRLFSCVRDFFLRVRWRRETVAERENQGGSVLIDLPVVIHFSFFLSWLTGSVVPLNKNIQGRGSCCDLSAPFLRDLRKGTKRATFDS